MRIRFGKSTSPSNAAGYTLIEVATSAVLVAVISVGSISFFKTTMDSMGETVEHAKEANKNGAGLDIFNRDLSRTDPDHIRIDTSDPNTDVVEMQIIIGLDTSGPIWGAIVPGISVNDGRQPNWSVRYAAEDNVLVRRWYDDTGTATPYFERVVTNLPTTGTGKVFEVHRPDPTNAPMLLSIEIKTQTSAGSDTSSSALSTSVRIGGTTALSVRVPILGSLLGR